MSPGDLHYLDISLETLPRIAGLRAAQIAQKPQVCIERAYYITRYLKELADASEPMEIRYARAVHFFLSHKRPVFFDDNLLAGTTTSKPFGAPVYPELTGMTIWPELDTISTRLKNPLALSSAEADELNFNIFPYWMDKNILEVTRLKHPNLQGLNLMEKFVFFIATKAGTISHTIPDYRIALTRGVNAMIAEASSREERLSETGSASDDDRQKLSFWRAVQIALTGITVYAQHLSAKAADLAAKTTDTQRKENYLALARICKKVPAEPAETFREAVNALWIIQVAIHAENINMAMSPGRLDQVLYPYYRRDKDRGLLSDMEAAEIISCLWLKLNDNTNLVPETAEELFGGAGTVPAVTVGGITEAGNDAVNELTYLMLRVTELLKLRDPSLNARYHYEKNAPAYLERVAAVVASTKSVPAFHNDAADIRTLENQGIETADARNYAVIGCVEMGVPGKTYDASSAIMFNLVSALELALYNGRRPVTGDDLMSIETGDPTALTHFNEFWEAFKAQVRWLLGKAIELNEAFGRVHQDIFPTPLLSAFFDGPLQKGRDLIFGGARYNASGATHIGFADTVDSLNAIEKGVFIDRICTFSDLLAALKADFAGFAKLHAWFVNKAPKYGTDDPIAVKNSQNLVRFLYDFYQSHINYRGGRYKPAYWTMTNHAGQGKLTGALPNGRKANKVFASGITPVSQAARDLSACLRAVGGLDGLCIPMGEALNLKYPSCDTPEDIRKFAQAIEAYFRGGGLHVQFNILSYEMLLDAKKHPEKYPELLVRVSGYSAYFKDLNEAMKDEIITRTEYDLKRGRANPFPVSDEILLGHK